MNCCDYDCTQGRDCPARTQTCRHCRGLGYDASGYPCTCTQPAKVAKVAKVKRRHHGGEPLPHNAWRAYVRHLAKWMLIAVAASLAVSLMVGVVR